MAQKLYSAIPCVLLLMFSTVSFAGSISGTITKDSRPAAHVIVIFQQNGREVARAITGDDGFYFVRDLQRGTYTVRILHEHGVETRSVDIDSSGANFNFIVGAR